MNSAESISTSGINHGSVAFGCQELTRDVCKLRARYWERVLTRNTFPSIDRDRSLGCRRCFEGNRSDVPYKCSSNKLIQSVFDRSRQRYWFLPYNNALVRCDWNTCYMLFPKRSVFCHAEEKYKEAGVCDFYILSALSVDFRRVDSVMKWRLIAGWFDQKDYVSWRSSVSLSFLYQFLVFVSQKLLVLSSHPTSLSF